MQTLLKVLLVVSAVFGLISVVMLGYNIVEAEGIKILTWSLLTAVHALNFYNLRNLLETQKWLDERKSLYR